MTVGTDMVQAILAVVTQMMTLKALSEEGCWAMREKGGGDNIQERRGEEGSDGGGTGISDGD